MRVLVDTDVWSEAFRSKPLQKSKHVSELRLLMEEGRVEMIGIVRMEILSGIREGEVFDRIRHVLDAFVDRRLDTEVFVLAARFFNLCRSKGIQGSGADFIICACSALWKIPILSKDKGFHHYRKWLPIGILEPRT